MTRRASTLGDRVQDASPHGRQRQAERHHARARARPVAVPRIATLSRSARSSWSVDSNIARRSSCSAMTATHVRWPGDRSLRSTRRPKAELIAATPGALDHLVHPVRLVGYSVGRSEHHIDVGFAPPGKSLVDIPMSSYVRFSRELGRMGESGGPSGEWRPYVATRSKKPAGNGSPAMRARGGEAGTRASTVRLRGKLAARRTTCARASSGASRISMCGRSPTM